MVMAVFILEINNLVKAPFKYEALFKQLGRKTLILLKIKKPLAVSLAFVGPAEMKMVNRRYRGKNKTTDVLSFEGINEIIIDWQQANKQAKQHRHPVRQELSILFVHGLLHVLGYEDETDRGAKEMARLVDKVLA